MSYGGNEMVLDAIRDQYFSWDEILREQKERKNWSGIEIAKSKMRYLQEKARIISGNKS